ncbi:MAG: hypothetical protein Q4B17_13355 [Lautropia sp.]|nr:hypothetical protein [Lautropia sp.]
MSGIQVRKVPAFHGWQWVREGFRLFARAPLPLLLLALVLKTLLDLFPLLGTAGLVITKLLIPVLIVGFMSVMRQLAPDPLMPSPAGRPPVGPDLSGVRPAPRLSLDAFISWARQGKALQTVLLLGVISLGFDLLVSYLSNLPAELERLAASINKAGQMPHDQQAMAELFGPVLQSLFLSVLISLPFYLFLWYAPVFAGLHGLPLMKSIVFSCVAVSRNLLAFLCHGLSLFGLTIVLAILIQLLGAVLGAGGDFGLQSMLIFLLQPLVICVLGCAYWACYLDTVEVTAQQRESLPASGDEGTDDSDHAV